jgi:ABC-type polysaccharide/polyol phosphate export permease
MSHNLALCFERKDLFKQMIVSKLIVSQKDMFLGYLWWILDPLLLMFIFWFLVGVIFGRGGPDYPLFVLCGLVPYRAFAVSFSQSVTSVSGKYGLISQINFPRIFLPLADVFANHVKLTFGFLVVVVVSLIYRVHLNYTIFFLLVPLAIQVILVCGLAMLSSVLGVYFRDLQNLAQFLLRVLFYFSPVLYSIERVPERFRGFLYLLNPIAPLLEIYRSILMRKTTIDFHLLSVSVVQALFFFLAGYFLFIRQEKNLLKNI